MRPKSSVALLCSFTAGLFICPANSRGQNLVQPFTSQNEPHCLTNVSITTPKPGSWFLIKNACKVNLHIYWGPWANDDCSGVMEHSADLKNGASIQAEDAVVVYGCPLGYKLTTRTNLGAPVISFTNCPGDPLVCIRAPGS
jgi:hypothetical protein